jgi:hypothetical protein
LPIIVCHDEIVVEYDAERATDAKAWLEGMKAVINGMDEVDVLAEVEARIARSWGESG